MTTEGVKETAEALLKAAGELDADTTNRVRELRRLRSGLHSQTPKLRRAFRVGQQRLSDQDLDLHEELSQLLGKEISREPAVLEVVEDGCEEQLESLRQELETAQGDLATARQQRDRLNADLEEARRNVGIDPAELDRLRDQFEEATRQIERLTEERDRLNADLEEACQETERLREEMRSQSALSADLEARLEESNRRAEEFRTWLDESNRRAQQLQEEADRLRSGTAVLLASPPPPPPAPPAPTPTSGRRFFDVRRWTWLQRGLAVVLGVVGLIVASVTYGFDGSHGAGHDAFTVLWFVALTGLGFYGGGNLGDWWQNRRRSS